MESAVFDFSEIQKSEKYGIKKYQDAVYRGELNGGKRDGYGVMLYRKNRLYEGCWVKDLREGRGYERYSNGNRYEGEFK